MHPFLSDPENAKAYQTLCDCPSGSTRSWAAKAGWTKSRMERFLLKLRALGLARIDVDVGGSMFVPAPAVSGVQDASRTRPAAYLGSTAVQELDKLPRYGATPDEEAQLRAAMKLIQEMNRASSAKFDGGYVPVPLDNLGSIAAAKKILKVVPLDRAVALVFEACMAFTPDKTGGDLPRSLGHPFITKYVLNEYRRIERELARGQLSLLFVERTDPPRVYGARKQSGPQLVADVPPSTPEDVERALAESRAEFERIAGSPTIPRRL